MPSICCWKLSKCQKLKNHLTGNSLNGLTAPVNTSLNSYQNSNNNHINIVNQNSHSSVITSHNQTFSSTSSTNLANISTEQSSNVNIHGNLTNNVQLVLPANRDNLTLIDSQNHGSQISNHNNIWQPNNLDYSFTLAKTIKKAKSENKINRQNTQQVITKECILPNNAVNHHHGVLPIVNKRKVNNKDDIEHQKTTILPNYQNSVSQIKEKTEKNRENHHNHNNGVSDSTSARTTSSKSRAFLNETRSTKSAFAKKLGCLPQIKQLTAPSKQTLLNGYEQLNDEKSSLDGLILYECRAAIDKKPTLIEETSPIVLRYRTPYFRANATILLPPIKYKHTWTIGWIQACEQMKFVNHYGKIGKSAWEIPQLENNLVTAVSDSDGISYPWYGNSSEIATICGPTKHHKKVIVRMNDNFYPSVTWDIPISERDQSKLTLVERDQKFATWLAALNENTGELVVLRTVRWRFKISIKVDPDKPLGQRATLLDEEIINYHNRNNNNNSSLQLSSKFEKLPTIITNQTSNLTSNILQTSNSNLSKAMIPVNSNVKKIDENIFMPLTVTSNSSPERIPLCAMMRPSANQCQVLFWKPTESPQIIVVPPKELFKVSQKLVIFSGKAVMNRKDKSKYVSSISRDTLQRMKMDKIKQENKLKQIGCSFDSAAHQINFDGSFGGNYGFQMRS